MNIKSPFTIWLMGPTSSGKTTLAINLINRINKKKFPILHFDGDEIRDLFGKDFGFGKSNRMKVIQTLVRFSIKSNVSQVSTIVSALTAHKNARDYIKKNVPNLFNVYIKCPIKVCEKRDPKGLYKKARAGEIDTLIGYNSIYRPPINPDLMIDTSKKTIDECTYDLIQYFNLPIIKN